MNVAELSMSRDKAQQALAHYRAAIAAGTATADDRLIERGYRALARGRRLIDVRETFAAAGVDSIGRPRLAIARADAQFCWLDRYSHGGVDQFRWKPAVRRNESR